MPHTIDPAPRRSGFWLPWALSLGLLAPLLMLVESSQLQLTGFTRPGVPNDFWWKVRHLLPPWLLITVLAPPAAWLAWRYPPGPPIGRRLALHVSGAVLFASIRLGALALYQSGLGGEPFVLRLGELLRAYFVWDLILYAAIVGATQAVRLAQELRNSRVDALELKAALAEAQLAGLRNQLNPHFVFNVLNTVSSLIVQSRSDEAMKVLHRLGLLMRQILRQPAATVSLEEELGLLRQYVELEQLRFGDRLRVEIELSDGLGVQPVPPFLLQPLVENAIRHGTGQRADSGTVRIRAFRTGASLVVDVDDDGPGLPAGWSLAAHAGTGLTLTRSRLQHSTAGRGRLDLVPLTGGGTRARVIVPLQPAP